MDPSDLKESGVKQDQWGPQERGVYKETLADKAAKGKRVHQE